MLDHSHILSVFVIDFKRRGHVRCMDADINIAVQTSKITITVQKIVHKSVLLKISEGRQEAVIHLLKINQVLIESPKYHAIGL